MDNALVARVDAETIQTLVTAIGPAVGVVIGVWIRGRQQRRTRWHSEQQRVLEELLGHFDAAKYAIGGPGADRHAAVVRFREASHRAELLVPAGMVTKVQAMHAALATLQGSMTMLDDALRSGLRSDRSTIAKSDAVGRAMNGADRARAELLAAARQHLGV